MINRLIYHPFDPLHNKATKGYRNLKTYVLGIDLDIFWFLVVPPGEFATCATLLWILINSCFGFMRGNEKYQFQTSCRTLRRH